MHLHYSPFQFATSEQVSDNAVKPAKKQIAKMKKLVKEPPKQALMSCADAHEILRLKSPTAFISPNAVDTMRTVHRVFGN